MWMQTVLTRMILTNAHVKRDTPTMDTHVQVILKITLLIVPNKTNFCKSSHNFKQRYPRMFIHRVTMIYIFLVSEPLDW